ncbi:phosphoglycerate mutase [Penicillium cataractarum]|uniref:Phosphoglycerate mutase n=1 Tax=Penicillium cataractarum TaxID=2100454 RepID=A0A9W9VW46_9EURO|nr:phosphoglycerate mutase [Penicillium cataractarum]KAJ5390481.1 phosphoglycerate mutase [Penicillium cataractarum]
MTLTKLTTEPDSFKFSTVPGYFLQDEPTTDPDTFDYSAQNFGLIPKEYDSGIANSHETQWQRFSRHITHLNETASPQTKYKVLFLGRHGEGVHNVAERRYGTKAWDEYWSLLDGDEYGTWLDAHLTEVGIAQAQTAHDTWARQLETGIPAPQSYYVSPLHRCCQTAQVTFEGLDMPLVNPFQPLVKELLRETMGEHTCDRRSTKSAIAADFPRYRFEPRFTEEDELWDPKVREADGHRDRRLLDLLNDIFATDENVFLSLTAHSGAITSILSVIGHRKFSLATGAVIPVVVKAEKR